MAETWIQASFAFTCSNAEMALLEEAFLAAANLADDFEPDPPSPEFFVIFPPDGDDAWSGLRRIFTDPDFPSLGAGIEGGNSIEHPDRSVVHVFGTTDFQPNAIASLTQRCCRASLEQAPIGFEYSWSCSKPRVGEFGGGWCVVHPDHLDSGTTGEALAAALRI
ncbi:hypothetical protein QLH51_12845 [Sphingomonas sp. 2R-10]|uniref:hypothetical protein n=1 Tax=Sphingomonas sp. 2R-10 TaxID=3045148 RepID=UPI000F772ABF|nr:hypothetical protein [Sphingomonas sp. 2R-10]MDJ0277685.1 hypothetical protein [Sphingomonas sp. 2R-10]